MLFVRQVNGLVCNDASDRNDVNDQGSCWSLGQRGDQIRDQCDKVSASLIELQ